MAETNAIPTFARGAKDHVSDIFCGDFSQVMIGMRLGVQLRFLTERYAENGQVGILAYFRGDIQIPRPAALAVYRYIQVEAKSMPRRNKRAPIEVTAYPVSPLEGGCRAGVWIDGILVRCEDEPDPCPVTVHVAN